MSNIISVLKIEILNACNNFEDCLKVGLWNILFILVGMYLPTPSVYIYLKAIEKTMPMVNIFSLKIKQIPS